MSLEGLRRELLGFPMTLGKTEMAPELRHPAHVVLCSQMSSVLLATLWSASCGAYIARFPLSSIPWRDPDKYGSFSLSPFILGMYTCSLCYTLLLEK